MAEKKFFVDINLQGNKLVNPVVGSNSSMTTAGSFQYNAGRLEYYNGSTVEEVANLNDIAAVTGGLILQGGYDAATNTPDIAADSSVLKGFFWVVTAAGSFLGEAVQVGDSIIAKQDNPGATAANWLILQGNVVIATDSVDGIVRLATQAEADAGTEGGAVVITPATLQGKIDADITPLINDKVSKSGDAMTGNLNMTGQSILNIGTAYINNLNSADFTSPINLDINIDAGTENTIINLPAPTNGGDAANKTYVDDNTSNKLPLAGGTMSGGIDMDNNGIGNVTIIETAEIGSPNAADILVSNNLSFQNVVKIVNLAAPTDGGDAANKTYVDDQDALKLSLTGGTMTGSIDMNGNYLDGVSQIVVGTITNTGADPIEVENKLNANSGITNLPAPINGADAANKDYVDNAAATAESNANDYTDNEIAATRYSANIQTTDWTVFGGDPANGYIATITHNLNCYYPVIQLNDDNTGYAVEMATQYNNLNETNIFSNFIPSGLIVATLIKAAV